MNNPQFDITPFLGQDEGQHFDRKSLFDGPEGAKRARDRRAVRDQVAEYVAAFANAEGGVLVLGIEDDRTLTGHKLT
jgi:ATP-dependent DNA helicase RecG